MTRHLAFFAVGMLCACGGSRGAPQTDAAPATTSSQGVYQFSASTPNQLVRGNLRVTQDGVGVDFETACQQEATTRGLPSGMPSSTGLVRYYCSGSWLTFDRRNPMAAKWYAIVQKPQRREVCARYETQNGRQVCASRTTETYYVNETRSGMIQVQRVP